ncbi:MAG: hypothetical protein K1X75_11255 [Leptospirales bacterium]|nr:hypothetical protein [Leptospirales bacterium]
MHFLALRSPVQRAALFVILLVAGLGTGAALLSQNIQSGQPAPTSAPDSGAGQQAGVVLLEQFNPLAVTSPNFVVTGVNFDRRFAGNGWGEFLDVVFDLRSNIAQDLDLFVFVAAFYETDAVDMRQRQWIPYPSWRPRDFDRETFLVRHIAISPADIPDDKIWTDQDPEFQRQQLILNRMRNSVAGVIPIEDFHPPFWKYEHYMMQHPTEGLRITLSGENSPPTDRSILTNYIPPTQEERANRVHKTLIQHKYTVEFSRRSAIFRSHHFSRFRPNYAFFNRAAILVFDAKKAEQAGQQGGSAAGESALLYKRVFGFHQPLRNN